MKDIVTNIASNLALLRKTKKLTQKELAQVFNYSDKAVSRWENGESLPDINMLTKICEFYGVEFEWLLNKHEEAPKHTNSNKNNIKLTIAALLVVGCFTLATVIFVYSKVFMNASYWMAYIWTLPSSLVILSACSFRWWNMLTTCTLLSLAMWTLLLSCFLHFLTTVNIWPIFLLGIPLQAIIALIYILKK